MKKVTNITLGGIVFVIEEDAYEALASYLKSIETTFAGSEDYAEISADIESAIAEKLRERGRNEKVAVTLLDVEAVIKEMGTAKEVVGEEEVAASNEDGDSHEKQADAGTKKRLYRNTDDAIIAGVASGIAQYFGIDPVIVRVLFVISVFFNGIGVFAYVLLWLIVPAAETTSQKYAMRGVSTTVAEITEHVKKNLDSIDKEDLERGKGAWKRIRGFLEEVFDLAGKLLRALFRVLRYVVGVVLVLVGALGIAAVVSGYSIVLLSERTFLPEELQIILETLLGSTLGIITIITSFVVVVIPLVVLKMAGGSLLVKRSLFTVSKSISLVVVFIIALMLTATTTALHVEKLVGHFDSLKKESYEGTFNGVRFKAEWENDNFSGFIASEDIEEFNRQLEEAVRIEIGTPIEGFEPAMFIEVFPGLQEADFNNVDAMIGYYEYKDGALTHNLEGAEVVHSAAGAVTPEGIGTLLGNVIGRISSTTEKVSVADVVLSLKEAAE